MLSYYKADVKVHSDYSVQSHSNLTDIMKVAVAISNEPWTKYFECIAHHVLLVNATGAFAMGIPLLREALVTETLASIKSASYVSMKGNHQAM